MPARGEWVKQLQGKAVKAYFPRSKRHTHACCSSGIAWASCRNSRESRARDDGARIEIHTHTGERSKTVLMASGTLADENRFPWPAWLKRASRDSSGNRHS